MKIRFGYVANALGLWDASPSKTLTFARYSKLPKEERLDTLKSVTAQNLHHTKRILCYNIAHEIELYRFSSMLAPLATHPEAGWDYITPFKEEWQELGRLIKKYQIRTSFHPGQYTLFTSPRKEVTENAVQDMEYHYRMLEAMGVLNTSIMNIHIGGAYGDKVQTLERFHENLKELPDKVQYYMTLENDDKTYDVKETLEASEKEKVPMTLDYHHYMANKGEVELENYLERIFNTWSHRDIPPKVHISSPKSASAFRSHADYVDLVFIQPFLKIAKELNRDFDIMIEAKQKNLAMLQLVEDIAKIRGVKRLSGASVEY